MKRLPLAGAVTLAAAGEALQSQQRPVFRTNICDLLGIEYPIVQAPMQFVATPRLVAAVGEAGGMGILAGIGIPLDVLRDNIREVKRFTTRPFGVNLVLHSSLRPPVDPATLSDDQVRSVQSVLNRFRARLLAALALGASGVLVGTRFIASAESGASAFHKEALVQGDSDRTTLSDAFTGHYARFLTNTYIEEFRASGVSALPPIVQQMISRDIVEAAAQQGVAAFYPLYAGQGVGMIDSIPGAAAIVRSMIDEARATLEAMPARVRLQSPA